MMASPLHTSGRGVAFAERSAVIFRAQTGQVLGKDADIVLLTVLLPILFRRQPRRTLKRPPKTCLLRITQLYCNIA